MKYFLLAAIFVSISGFAKSPDFSLYLCSGGRLANCSDCSDKAVKGLNSFEVDKAKKRVLVLEFDKEKRFSKSFVLEQCSIFDSGNWYCSYGTDDQYYRYKSHGGFIEFVFKDFPEYSDVVRLCGVKISPN